MVVTQAMRRHYDQMELSPDYWFRYNASDTLFGALDLVLRPRFSVPHPLPCDMGLLRLLHLLPKSTYFSPPAPPPVSSSCAGTHANRQIHQR